MDNIINSVVCPFFHSVEQRKIICEGVQKKTTNHIVFQYPTEKMPYMKNFCCNVDNYMNCRVCDMLSLKWEYEAGKKE